MALITKTDFSEYVQFTTNIPDRLINYHRDKAETLDFKPLVPANFWTAINSASPPMGAELQDFFNVYIKPIIITYSYIRFYVEHGRNVTQFGLVQPREETSEAVSEEARADVRNSYKRDLDSYLSIFYARLCEVDYTFDGVKYEFGCKKKGHTVLIKAI